MGACASFRDRDRFAGRSRSSAFPGSLGRHSWPFRLPVDIGHDHLDLIRGLDQLGALLAALNPEDVGRPNPCPEWTVADLSDHIVNSVAGMATMAKGGTPDWAASTHHDNPASALDREGRALVEALGAGDGAFPAGMAAGELAVHTYDLATALGRETADLDPEVAEVGHAFMTSSMTDAMRGSAFGPEQPAPAGTDAYERIAAFTGRSV